MQQADKPWLARLKKKIIKKHKSGSGCGSVGFAIARVRGLAGCVIPGRQGRAGQGRDALTTTLRSRYTHFCMYICRIPI